MPDYSVPRGHHRLERKNSGSLSPLTPPRIPPHLNFRHLKRHVSIEQVLAAKGLLAVLRRRGATLVGACPIHRGDNPGAFVVHLDRNLWRCFTRCDMGGDVVEFVRRLDQKSYRETADYLAALASAPLSFPAVHPSPSADTTFHPFVHRLRLQAEVAFLQDKGIRPSTASRFDVGWYPGQGFLQGCIAVRLHDPHGRPLGYTGRRLDPVQVRKFGKWKFPPRLPRNQLLYNFHRIRRSAPLVLTECPWSVMRLDQIQIPAVALLGLHLATAQQQLLASTPSILLMLDADPAGRAATQRLRLQLAQSSRVRVVSLPDGYDPDDLTDDELHRCLEDSSADSE